MHLNECISIAQSVWESKSHPIVSFTSIENTAPHWECVQSWMFKSTTSFYNHKEMEERLAGHPWFGLLCWTFSVGGLIMLLVPPKCVRDGRVNFPYYSFALYLLFIQGAPHQRGFNKRTMRTSVLVPDLVNIDFSCTDGQF